MARRFFLAGDLLPECLRGGPSAEPVEALVAQAERGEAELWFSGLALLAAAGRRADRAEEDPPPLWARLLAAGAMVPIGQEALASLGPSPDPRLLAPHEQRLCARMPGLTVLTGEGDLWRRAGFRVSTAREAAGGEGAARVALVDLASQLASLAGEVQGAIWRVLSSSSFILGEEVGRFEEELAEFCGAPHAVALASGTDALHLSLRALGVGAGDGVLTAAHTFVATAEPAAMCGARPLFVDVDPDDYCMSPGALEAFLRERAVREGEGFRDRVTGLRLKALLPVHLYGQPADMERLAPLAREFGLLVLEDAAQAIGASLNVDGVRRPTGSFGEGAAFSFYPAKNLGAYGDAGAFATHREDLARAVRSLRNHGRVGKYAHEVLGWNSRMDALQAAVLRVKLRHLGRWTEARRAAARRYEGLLRGVGGIVLPSERPGAFHVYHLYVVRVPPGVRGAIQERLEAAGIETGVHYPVPLHLQPPFAEGPEARGTLPETERAAEEVLSLPLYPEITEADQVRVAGELRGALEEEAGDGPST